MDAFKSRTRLAYRLLSAFIAFTFTCTSVIPPSYAQTIASLNLPVPGTMVGPSQAFVPVLLKGMTIHPDNPLQFDFIIDSGNTNFTQDQIKDESQRLVKYFLASMTIPKDDLWVNLSPYEKDRIIPDELGKTELGRDMLAQDYILKQLTASLMYPEKELGKAFWDKVYKQAKEKFGTTEIPVDTFNKVWILPETATVYEHGQTVYIVEAKLKVMLDSDYLAMSHNVTTSQGHQEAVTGDVVTGDRVTTEIVKEIILPAIEREVNEGQNFAPLRQIYHSLILAKWYKETIKNSLLSKIYVDQKKIAGVNIDDATLKDQIYAQYMEAYKKGVFNYIKEDYDQLSAQPIPRKYFSGGLDRLMNFSLIKLNTTSNPATVVSAQVGQQSLLTTRVNPQKEGKQSSSPVEYIAGREMQTEKTMGGYFYNNFEHGFTEYGQFEISVIKQEDGQWDLKGDAWVDAAKIDKSSSFYRGYKGAIHELFNNTASRGKLTTEQLYGEIVKLQRKHFAAETKQLDGKFSKLLQGTSADMHKNVKKNSGLKNKILTAIFADYGNNIYEQIMGARPTSMQNLSTWLDYKNKYPQKHPLAKQDDSQTFINDVTSKKHYVHLAGSVNSLTADMKAFGEELLEEMGQGGKVTFVVKKERVGSDAIMSDVELLLMQPEFQKLNQLKKEGRFVVIESGTGFQRGTNFETLTDEFLAVLSEVANDKAVLGLKGELNNFTSDNIQYDHYRFFLARDIATNRRIKVFWDNNEHEAPFPIIIKVKKNTILEPFEKRAPQEELNGGADGSISAAGGTYFGKETQLPDKKKALIAGSIVPAGWEVGMTRASTIPLGYDPGKYRTLLSHDKIFELHKNTVLTINGLYFFTPKLKTFYNRLAERNNRQEEKIEDVNFYLDSFKEPQSKSGGLKTHLYMMPLYNKGYVGMEGGKLKFGRLQLKGGSIQASINGKTVTLKWQEKDVDSEEVAVQKETLADGTVRFFGVAPDNTKDIVVYTPMKSGIFLSEDAPKVNSYDNNYSLTVGNGRVNIVIINNKITLIKRGDVLLPPMGIVISLTKDEFEAKFGKDFVFVGNKGTVSYTEFEEGIEVTYQPAKSELDGFDWYYGGGTMLYQDGRNLVADENSAKKNFSEEGWFKMLSMQTQETQVQAWVRGPRAILGTAKRNTDADEKVEPFVFVFSGRLFGEYDGVNFAEAIELIERELEGKNYKIINAINLDGGSSAALSVKDVAGNVTTVSKPGPGPDNAPGFRRPVSSIFRIEKPDTNANIQSSSPIENDDDVLSGYKREFTPEELYDQEVHGIPAKGYLVRITDDDLRLQRLPYDPIEHGATFTMDDARRLDRGTEENPDLLTYQQAYQLLLDLASRDNLEMITQAHVELVRAQYIKSQSTIKILPQSKMVHVPYPQQSHDPQNAYEDFRAGTYPASDRWIEIAIVNGRDGNQSSSPVAVLSPERRALLNQAAKQFNLKEFDKEYLAEQWRQSLSRGQGAQIKIILDENNPEDPGNFILASRLTDEKRREWLGSFSFADIRNAESMGDVIVTLNSLDGGIGEAVNRLKFKQKRAQVKGESGEGISLGGKGTDLGYDVTINGRTEFVSIAEAKVLKLIDMVEKDANRFGEVYFQPLVNYQSKESYEKLLASTYLKDRLDDAKPAGQKQSYQEKMESLGIKLPDMLEQADLPWIEENTGNISLKPDEKDFRYRQPGGHGQWGFYFLWNTRFTKPPQDGKTRIRVFYNGDNINSRVSKDIVGKMKTANWPIVKLTTVAMAIDKKGGKDGVRVVEVNGKKVYVPAQMEEADAKTTGQTKEFYAAGQENGFGEPGKQPFNTNIFYINETLLHDILTQLATAIGEERFKEIISPSYIQKLVKAGKDGNKYIPIDGAIGTAMHNLNEFFMTSTDPNVRRIVADLKTKYRIDRLLYFVDVPRTEFFTPVKATADIYLQMHTDYYNRLDGVNWVLEENRDEGQTLTPPEITLGDTNDKEDTAYWKELQNLIDAFGEQKVKELKSLVIKGKVKMVDARLKGNVEIINASGREVDLKQVPEMQAHIINGELVLDNLKVSIDEQGHVQVRSSSLVVIDESFRREFSAGVRAGVRTFAMIKPDATRLGVQERIIADIKAAGFDVVTGPSIKFDEATAKEFYKAHKDKDFFTRDLIPYVTSGASIPLFVRSKAGSRATIAEFRELQTKLRAKYNGGIVENRLHASDSAENALAESQIIFNVIANQAFREAEQQARKANTPDTVKAAMQIYANSIDLLRAVDNEQAKRVLKLAESRYKRLKKSLADFDEKFDIVDENGRDIRIVTRAEAHANGLRHKNVNVMVFSHDGREFLGQIRAADKDVFPGAFSNSAAGHVKSKAGSRATALAEGAQEIATKDGSRNLKFEENRLMQIGEEYAHGGYLKMYELSWLDDEEKNKLNSAITNELANQTGDRVKQIFHTKNEELNTMYLFTYNSEKSAAIDQAVKNIAQKTGINPGVKMDNREMKSLYVYRLTENEETTVNEIMTALRGTSNVEENPGEGLGEVAGLKWVEFDDLITKFRTNPEKYTDAFVPFLSADNIIGQIKDTISSSPVSSKDEVGGIDMNAIDLEHQGAGVDIQFDPAELQEIIDAGIDGFAPVIINITPLPSVLPLLGLSPANKEEELEVSRLN